MDGFQKPQSYLSWSTAQVISWLSGLDDITGPYLAKFKAGSMNGKWLNALTADTLTKFGVTKVGHQMIILDVVKQLQNQFSAFENETLQSVLFRVSRSCMCITSAINSLLAITERQDNREPNADSAYPGIFSDIQEAASYVVRCVLSLMSSVFNAAFWLSRPPFSLLSEMSILKQNMMKNTIVTNRCIQKAIGTQLSNHFKDVLVYIAELKEHVDNVLYVCSDSIILTPCGMELVQIRKSDSVDYGFDFNSNMHNVHIIVSVQVDSPAFLTGKISKGDEVVEVNNQIVIGWPHYRVVELMRLSARRVCLRLRKRPAHCNDFIGVPYVSRRQRLINQHSPCGSLSQAQVCNITGSGYILTRNPKRRAPLSGALNTAQLTTTQENTSNQTSISPPPTSSHIPVTNTNLLSPTLTSELGEIKITTNTDSNILDTPSNVRSNSHTDIIDMHVNNNSTDEDDNDKESMSYVVSRLISSTPNTPLMMIRMKDNAEVDQFVKDVTNSLQSTTETTVCKLELDCTDARNTKFNNSLMSTSIDSDFIKSNKMIGDTLKTAVKSSPCSLNNKSRFPPFTHRRICSGDPKLLRSIQSKRDEIGDSSNKSGTLDKSLKSSHRGSLDDIFFLRKFGFGSKKSSRRISCKALGQGDCQGWLWLKKVNSFTSKYVKRWCVCKNSTFYYYRDTQEETADGLILLEGFTITPAAEAKSGKFAFYIMNDWVRFVFATDSAIDRSKWMNKLGLSSIGLSSSIPTSRIGGFHPGYVLPNCANSGQQKEYKQTISPRSIITNPEPPNVEHYLSDSPTLSSTPEIGNVEHSTVFFQHLKDSTHISLTQYPTTPTLNSVASKSNSSESPNSVKQFRTYPIDISDPYSFGTIKDNYIRTINMSVSDFTDEDDAVEESASVGDLATDSPSSSNTDRKIYPHDNSKI